MKKHTTPMTQMLQRPHHRLNSGFHSGLHYGFISLRFALVACVLLAGLHWWFTPNTFRAAV